MPSPFLNPAASTAADGLAILHLRRDNLMPVILEAQDDSKDNNKEDKVATTRFGSFPHSTLIDKPWGSQILASHVHGGRARNSNKRKADALGDDGESVKSAASGFIHVLPPTPESWTAGLPHRTQVVYTPDYSYILHRLRARPGATLIEAGSGSGSFTHAAARAVFNGYPSLSHQKKKKKKQRRFGKVCSFEFHEQRASKVREEIKDHGLEEIVFPTHRDVYSDGFLLGDPKTGESPRANAIFLDLPAPWLAIKHLVRNPPDGTVSPLDPSSPVYICTFSPCMEQVQKTISTLRQHGWLSISMVEVNHRRIEVRREYYGLGIEGVRRAIVFPKSVDEAVGKLRLEEARQKEYRKLQKEGIARQDNKAQQKGGAAGDEDTPKDEAESNNNSNEPQLPLYEQGRLIHRTEPDLKTHTSYLVFAILPRVWSEEDERKCREAWPSQPDRNSKS
ncbi:hypothetical protein PISL3812_04298 [Talaromyces islandicus]|uniref:tRNA (adenine(58)-N(1))-methyltransferase catalytic subunit TRM61 n=1 Tax=Talaromyces islandicus TaxID=28573 RepID=A0A0U1LX84_TALIS|nr:hypothetical protein PISL3812_04298 [Talaromyces islandicus]